MPVFSRPLLDVTGCDIPGMNLSTIEKSILELIGSSGGGFENPIESVMGEVQGSIGDVLGQIGGGGGSTISVGPDGEIILDPNGNQTTYGYLADGLSGVNSSIANYRIHSDRLSGVSISKAFGGDSEYGPGGIQGEYPGLGGLQSVASQYNSLKETLKDPGQAAKDHYSPIFNSLFGPGDDMMRSMNSLVEGDIGNFLTNFPTGDITENSGLQDLARLGTEIQDFQGGIVNLMNDDNLQYEFALDFILKQTTGFSVLGMLDDPCFGTKLLEKIGSPDLKGLAGL
jgi:hypothetical protein